MVKLCALVAGVSASAIVHPDALQKFYEFETKFGKMSVASTRERRLNNFVKNLEVIEDLQRNERGSAVYSYLTPFADVSPEEFSSRLGLSPSGLDLQEAGPFSTDGLLDAYDWRENGFTNHIKNQLSCGSCWTFSVVANLEGAGFKETGQLVRLSEQELLDCSSKGTGTGTNAGCGGGSTDGTMQWMIDRNVGLEYEEDYPYTANGAMCSHKKANEVVKISHFILIPKDEDQIAVAMMQYGVLSVCANANNWHLYERGIYNQDACIDAGLNHGVALVAYGNEDGTPYWTIRNSWGVGYGEKGHIRLVRGRGMCGIQKRVVTATGITIDTSRPEPPFIIGPDCCETKNIWAEDDCHAYCVNHGGWLNWTEPGPYCGCYDGDGCTPYPVCNDKVLI